MMTDEELANYLHQKSRLAQNREDGPLSYMRSEILNRYRGEKYGENSSVAAEREGFSEFVTREVLETIEWAGPPINKVFLAGDRFVEFEPISQQDEKLAAQETDIVNHKILRANGGDAAEELIKWIKDTLLMPTAYLKVYVDETETYERQELTGIDMMTFAGLADNPNIEILEQRAYRDLVPVPDELLQPGGPTHMPIELMDLDIRRTKRTPTLRLESIPGEEVLVDGELTKTNLDHAKLVIHRQIKTHSELLKEGFDEDMLDEVGDITEGDLAWNTERVNRRKEEDEHIGMDGGLGSTEKADREYLVLECHAEVDYDEDGKDEMRRVVMIGKTIFENEEVNYQPFVAMSALLNPHRHIGTSLGQLAMERQTLNTVLHRQLLDNVYQQNTGKHVIDDNMLMDDGSTLNALTDQSAQYVVIDGAGSTVPPSQAIIPLSYTNLLGDLLPTIQHVEQATPMLTGIAPENDIDPEVIQQAKTGAFMSAKKSQGQRLELIIRTMAETGFKQLARKVHRLIRMHPSLAEAVRLRGTWVQPDPSKWIERTDMIVNVGLGFNGDDEDVQALTGVMQIQDKLAPMGLAGPHEAFNAAEKLVRRMGLGSARQFFIDPYQEGWQPPPPPEDPALITAKASAQLATQDGQSKVLDAQTKQFEAQTKARLEFAKLSQEDQKEFIKLELEERRAALEERKVQLEERAQALREGDAPSDRRKTESETRLNAAKEVETLAKAEQGEARVDIEKDKVDVERKKAENPPQMNGATE